MPALLVQSNSLVQATVEPVAAAPPTAPGEPVSVEKTLKRPRRWWSLKNVGLKVPWPKVTQFQRRLGDTTRVKARDVLARVP
jgi:hypothetical protein